MPYSPEPYERRWVPRNDTTDLHPLWGGFPGRLVRDRQWRRDIPMAASEPDWIEPSYVEGLGVLS